MWTTMQQNKVNRLLCIAVNRVVRDVRAAYPLPMNSTSCQPKKGAPDLVKETDTLRDVPLNLNTKKP